MFRDNETSNPTRLSGVAVPVKTLAPTDKLQDWEMGGIALNDPTKGLEYQLWKFTLVIDPETEHGQVFVQATTVPVTMLFEGDFISEIAGCFDQNMNPMVAYQQSGVPKIWWWDPTVPGMVHTTLPAGCIDLRVTLDDKRQFNVADSDIILSYVRAGSLYFRLQRERYATEHLLKEDILRLVYSAMNTQWRLQWKALGSGSGFTDPFLGDIVYDLCRQSGLLPENIDVSELYDPATDRVPGILIDSDDGLDKPLSWLMDMFQFDKVEHGKKLRFIKRGRPVVARIPFNKLVDDHPKTLKRTERDRAKLPRTVSIQHVDPDGGFAKNQQSASRRTNMSAGTGTENISSRVVLTADQAANAALRKLKIKHNEYEDFEFTTRLEYTHLTVGDVIEVEDFDGTWYRMHLTERNEDDGNIKWEAETDGGYLVYGNVLFPGKPLDPPVSTTPGTVGTTELDIFNLPVNRDADDELVLYVGARGTGSGWKGAALYASADGGITYSDTGTVIEFAANIGETLTAVTDTSTSVEVLVPEPLSSATAAQLDAGANRGIIGDEEMQWQGATLIGMSGELYHYNLTGLRRGILQSGAEAWGAGIRFAEFNDAIIAVKIDRSYYGATLYYKAVSLGGTVDEATALSYAFTYAASQTEWAGDAVDITAAAGGGITVSWDGAERLGTFGPSPYHSKYMTGYRVKFSDGHIIDTTAETVTYAAGMLGTAVEVRALNAITGEGPMFGATSSAPPGETPTFGFSGSFPDGFKGIPYILYPGDHGIAMSGGYWDANARGIVVPGVGAKCAGSELSSTRFVGIPYQTGVHTSKVRVDASSPAPGGSGSSDINQSVNVLARPTHGLLDLRFRDYGQYSRIKLEPSSPPWKKFTYSTPGTLFFYGVTSGKVCGQVILTGTDDNVLLGIDELRAPLGISTGIAVGVNKYSTAAKEVRDGTYSIELDCGTGNFWMYKDGTGLIHSGNVPLAPGKVYHICVTNEHEQTFTAEFNGGNEAWFMPVTQVGHGGIPVPAFTIPIAWGTVSPDYGLSLNGDGVVGALYADDPSGTALARANASYSSGRYRWIVESASSHGICVAAFNETHGLLGSAGSPDSAGVYVDNSGNHTLMWCFGGVTGTAALTPLTGNYLSPVMALDADSDTLKVYYMDHFGTPVLTYSLAIPTGQTWDIVARVRNGAFINRIPPPPITGYADAIVP